MRRTFTKGEKCLLAVFLLTLPFVTPRVRGDGIAYYAFARSLLIDHNLQFKGDWRAPNSPPILKTEINGVASVTLHTKTGHLNNYFSIGPALLWAPFLGGAHLGVLTADAAGAHIATDGFSRPYLVAMAWGTAVYGLGALWLSFLMARAYFGERWALMATLGIWFASPFVVYMYADPSWSHIHSAFTVALFVWYWWRTRHKRTPLQWAVLGAIAGLMVDTYYPNGLLLLFPLVEVIQDWREAAPRTPLQKQIAGIICGAAAFCVAMLPTLITKRIVFGGYFHAGYAVRWFWNSPNFWNVCFSSRHGLFTITPILLVAATGVFLLYRTDRELGLCAAGVLLLFTYTIGSYEYWHGVSSFGNRFFVSLTPLLVLGLAAALSEIAKRVKVEAGAILWRAAIVCGLLILWNLGLVFQWSRGLMPDVTAVVWQEVVYNQFRVVPAELMHEIEGKLSPGKAALDALDGR